MINELVNVIKKDKFLDNIILLLGFFLVTAWVGFGIYEFAKYDLLAGIFSSLIICYCMYRTKLTQWD